MSWRLVSIAVLIAAAPLLLLGESFESQVAAFIRTPRPPLLTAGLLVGLLATDIVMVVPSSVVVAYAAGQLGLPLTVLLATLGLSISCTIGYVFGRLTQASPTATPRLLAILAATRAVPIVAEAAVVYAGGVRVPLRPFLLTVTLANALVASLYAAIGLLGHQTGGEVTALVLSAAIPIALSLVVVWLFPNRTWSQQRSSSEDEARD